MSIDTIINASRSQQKFARTRLTLSFWIAATPSRFSRASLLKDAQPGSITKLPSTLHKRNNDSFEVSFKSYTTLNQHRLLQIVANDIPNSNFQRATTSAFLRFEIYQQSHGKKKERCSSQIFRTSILGNELEREAVDGYVRSNGTGYETIPWWTVAMG